MAKVYKIQCLIFAVITIVLVLATSTEAGVLKKNFYKKTCPKAEETIERLARQHAAQDRVVPARLIRMQFHDCFVRGCDGSVLLNSTANNSAEKSAPPNLSLQSFDVIDDIKEEVEKICPGVVSCADILALAARDAVVAGGRGPFWRVRTGRRDGMVSSRQEALTNIPPPTFNFTQLRASFEVKGLSVKDLVVLSGAHTIGVGHCNSFASRLYNFSGRGDVDPSLNATYAQQLKTVCKNTTDNVTFVPMDPVTPGGFDTSYYSILLRKMGLFTSDAALLTDSISLKIVNKLLNPQSFAENFKNSMEKMSEIEVLTGSQGEIRKKCAFVNN